MPKDGFIDMVEHPSILDDDDNDEDDEDDDQEGSDLDIRGKKGANSLDDDSEED